MKALRFAGLMFFSFQPATGSGGEFDGVRVAIIPQPVETEVREGLLTLDAQTVVVARPSVAASAALLAADLRAATGLPLPLREEGSANAIRVAWDHAMHAKGGESYRLEVDGGGVEIAAPGAAGIYYAGRSLLQLLDTRGGGGRLPWCRIADHPRFAWRGLMLDCSRTFQSPAYLKATIDRMAYYKLNVLHLHLTDDQGWRIEIKAFPELTGKGARFPEKFNEPGDHQGYYSREQMAELIAYAAERQVTIVPEIEMPGHTLALLSVMPQLSCTGGPFEIFPFFKGPSITEDIFCAGNPETFRVLEVILGEIVSLFPSTFIHIGGDEAPKTRWKHCPRCQQRMRDEGLKDEDELQSWFIRQAGVMLGTKGRCLIGWDEILEGGLAPGAAVMSWRGAQGGIAAATAGHDVVLSPTTHCYFDYDYHAIDSRKVYSFEPLAGFAPGAGQHVRGIQANFWSHIDRQPALVDRQLFPRLMALAERAWTPADRRDWDDYASRAAAQLPRLRQFGIQFHPGDAITQPKLPLDR